MLWQRENVNKKTGGRPPVLCSNAIFDPVELAKFSKRLGCFTALSDAGFFVKLAPFQLTLDTVNLQLFFQLTDCVFEVTSHFHFNHEITSFPVECTK